MPRIEMTNLERTALSKAAGESIPRTNGWRPIETAPEDGEILVWDGWDVWLVIIDMGIDVGKRQKFYPKGDYSYRPEPVDAIYWQPLPKPPEGEE